jgi:hypothetical protein
VTAQLRFDHNLATLQISLDRVGVHDDHVLFRLGRGAEEFVEVARCGIDDVSGAGLLSRERANDETPSVPAGVVERLTNVAGEMNLLTGRGRETALWLEFPEPRGLLYTLPWEQLLAPIGHRIFRLPTHTVRPLQPHRTLEIGICIGALNDQHIGAAETLFHLLTSYARQIGPSSITGTLHVFTDAASADSAYAAVGRMHEWEKHNRTWRHALPWFEYVNVVFEPPSTALWQVFREIVVHSPDHPLPAAKVGDASPVINPWLLWMRDELRKPLDLVHFVCRGSHSNQHGAMRLTTVLTDRGDQPSIDVAELNAFMTQVGAWALVMTGLDDDRSLAALRELVDAVTFERSGYFVVHDLQRDPVSEQLNSTDNRPTPAITRWSYPAAFSTYSTRSLAADRTSIFFPDSGRRAIQEGTADRWVVAAARVMEGLHMQWLPSMDREESDPAAVKALHNIAAFVDRYASEYANYSSSEGV